jgi:hypothetical protein
MKADPFEINQHNDSVIHLPATQPQGENNPL